MTSSSSTPSGSTSGLSGFFTVGTLGSRRPTQLLAEMMELFLHFLFMHRLPAWLRAHLECDDQDNIRQLTGKADRLEDQAMENAVNAVQMDNWHGVVGADRCSGQLGNKRNGADAEQMMSPSDAAAAAAEICHYHWKFGDKSYSCKGSAAWPCNWQGNWLLGRVNAVVLIVDQGLPSVYPAQVVVFGVDLMRSPQAVSHPCSKLPDGKQDGAASSPALHVGRASPTS
jgi:hypothetical protein